MMTITAMITTVMTITNTTINNTTINNSITNNATPPPLPPQMQPVYRPKRCGGAAQHTTEIIGQHWLLDRESPATIQTVSSQPQTQNMVVGFWKHQFTRVPISLAASQRKKIDSKGTLCNSVLASTGQPWRMS